MPSPAPIQHGQVYHIYNRGNNREDIFIEERNYRHFLQLYARHIEPVTDTYAYCLLRNHFHFLVRIKDEDETLRVAETLRVSLSPSQQFGNLFNAYAKAVNKAYQRTGSLFRNPFGRVLVTSDAHLVCLITYIHQNPQKHRFVDDFHEWPFSSYQALVSQAATRLKRDEVLAWFNGPDGFQALHQQAVSEGQAATLAPDDFD